MDDNQSKPKGRSLKKFASFLLIYVLINIILNSLPGLVKVSNFYLAFLSFIYPYLLPLIYWSIFVMSFFVKAKEK
jgi:hypothetical protein